MITGVDGGTVSMSGSFTMPHVKGPMAQRMTVSRDLYASSMTPTLSGPGRALRRHGVRPDERLMKERRRLRAVGARTG